jgi:glycerol kinase
VSILAIDQGTSGTKGIVVDEGGDVLAIAEAPLRQTYLPGGGVEQDPAALLASVLDAGKRAVAAAGVRVDAVALANQGETVLAWDRASGRPLSAAIVWQDRRAESLCRDRAAHREWVADRTGLVLDPYFSAPKMAWLRENVTAEGVVTTTDTWLVHQLTGAFVTDASTASRSLIFDVDEARWDTELLDLWGMGGEVLPDVVASDEVVGTTGAFGSDAAVAGLVVDQQAALFAEACLDPGTAKCTFGTGAFLLANTGGAAVRSRAGLTSSIAWQVRGGRTYCLDGQAYTAASAVRWLRDLGFISRVEEVDAVAAADSDGVLCVPALAGLAAPWWRPDARGSFTGLTLSTRPGHLVQAVLQGIASQVVELARSIHADFGFPLTRLRVDGGLTRSTSLMQATADLLQLPVDVYPTSHATAVGTAAFARLALDPAATPAEVVGGWTPAMTYEPRWSADRAAEHHERWRAAVAAVLPPEEKP